MQTLIQSLATLDLCLFLGILFVLLALLMAAFSVWFFQRMKVPPNHWSFIAVSSASGVVISWILIGVFRLAIQWIW